MMMAYFTEIGDRRAEVTDEGRYFRIHFGENGKWRSTYRVTNTIEKAKAFADEWVAKTGIHFLDDPAIVP